MKIKLISASASNGVLPIAQLKKFAKEYSVILA